MFLSITPGLRAFISDGTRQDALFNALDSASTDHTIWPLLEATKSLCAPAAENIRRVGNCCDKKCRAGLTISGKASRAATLGKSPLFGGTIVTFGFLAPGRDANGQALTARYGNQDA